MIDHVLGRPSIKSRKLQVLAVLSFWSFYLLKGPRDGPPIIRHLSNALSRRLTTWQTIVITMMYLYTAKHFSTLVDLASPEPLTNMYDATYFRATWVLSALDAGFWTAMKIRKRWLRDIASIVFTLFYLVSAESADEKVRKVRANLTVDHLRVSWNKSTTRYLKFLQDLTRPRLTRWPPRALRIPRPPGSDYKDPISAWLYFDGPLSELEKHTQMVFDVPGGGFVAMDPRCCDDRLLAWATKTGMPVLSLDYRKAPEHPYPFALNECYDAYTTVVRTRGRCIGLSGKQMPHIVVAGDSAGGNLAVAMTIMIIESGSAPTSRFHSQVELPIPAGMVLFYPSLDMNIGNWMSDEQMSLMQDRRTRQINRSIIRRKSMQYNRLAGTPHHSDDEEEPSVRDPSVVGDTEVTQVDSSQRARSPRPVFAHLTTTKLSSSQTPAPTVLAQSGSKGVSHQPEPLRTRLATSSMISYFNDRVLTPEMMRAMIILYIGPHNRPDFSQDYLLSPILAPDTVLAKLPKIYFLTGERDPLVDDTVIFAGRLKRVKAALHASGGLRTEYTNNDASAEGFDDKAVAEVALIPGISHGFLNFTTIFPPAWKYIDRSAGWIEDLFVTAAAKARNHKVSTHDSEKTRPARHHARTESSGDEGQVLEIGMTRLRARTLSDDTERKVDKETYAPAPEATKNAHTNGKTKQETVNRKLKRNQNPSLIRLASSDDILKRRMQGLTGTLNGLPED